ncbi:thioredoxin domain-containing protein 15-like protein, partial [Dinothrombium tinctorium]
VLQVKLVNSTKLLESLKSHSNNSKSECIIVMFYYSWCPFSAKAAVAFNALPRLYPEIHMFAIDAYVHNSINMRFGLVGIPSFLFFHGGKVVGKYNDSDPSIEGFISFIHKITGLQTSSEPMITEEDKLGPVPTIPEQRLDYVLIISFLFITLSISYLIGKTTIFQRMIENVRNTWREAEAQHEHLD